MTPPYVFFVLCLVLIIVLSTWVWLIIELTYKLTRYHKKESFRLRCLRVGRVYLLLSLPLTFSFIIAHNPNNGDMGAYIWIFLSAAYIFLIAGRVTSNPYEHLVDRGWEFIKASKDEKRDDVEIKEDYIKCSLKPRVQGILISLSFVIAIYIIIKVLEFTMFDDGSGVNFEIDSPVLIAVYVGGAVVATLFSEIILAYVFPPLVQE